MKAVVFSQPKTISVEHVPDPECGPDELLIEVASCGICGTDLHIYRNEYMSSFPLIPGHEFSGRVVEVGRDVTDFAIGDRVAVDPNLDCGHCSFCLDEQANHCLNWMGVGITRPGGFAEYTAAPARACYKLPDSLTDTQAAFIEPLSCVVYALKRLRVWPGNQVLIFGAGPMGLLLMQALQRSGASRVVMVEKQAQRLALTAQMGGVAVDASGDVSGQLHELAPHGFEIVIDATGVPAVIEGAFAYLKPRGQYLQFGVTASDVKVSISPYDLFHKDWTIIGSFAACHTFQPAIAWLANGVVDVELLVSDTVPMDSFEEAFQRFARGETLKVHVKAG